MNHQCFTFFFLVYFTLRTTRVYIIYRYSVLFDFEKSKKINLTRRDDTVKDSDKQTKHKKKIHPKHLQRGTLNDNQTFGVLESCLNFNPESSPRGL
jgi:hypothetical protein